jgi:hypothetical protein
MIEDLVNREVQLRGLIGIMIEHLTAIKTKSYLDADDRMRALIVVKDTIPTAIRYLNYIKTWELEHGKQPEQKK